MFWDQKNYSMIETVILWYDLREYICCFLCSACIFFPLVTWPYLPCIMNYQLCMTHDLATANRHDHAWTDEWAQNISTLSRPMSLMRLRDEHWQARSEGHLYEMKGTWKNYPTCFSLLDVGFMFILRRTDNSIIIWACRAVLPNITTFIFSNCLSSQTKLLRSLAFAAMLFSKRCLWICMVGLIQLP